MALEDVLLKLHEWVLIQVNFDLIQILGPKEGLGALSRDYGTLVLVQTFQEGVSRSLVQHCRLCLSSILHDITYMYM